MSNSKHHYSKRDINSRKRKSSSVIDYSAIIKILLIVLIAFALCFIGYKFFNTDFI